MTITKDKVVEIHDRFTETFGHREADRMVEECAPALCGLPCVREVAPDQEVDFQFFRLFGPALFQTDL